MMDKRVLGGNRKPPDKRKAEQISFPIEVEKKQLFINAIEARNEMVGENKSMSDVLRGFVDLYIQYSGK